MLDNQIDWIFQFAVSYFGVVHSVLGRMDLIRENSLQRFISYLGLMYPGTFLNGQAKTLFTYLYNFLSSWDFKELIMLPFELIKPHDFTKHCSAILQMNQGKGHNFSLLCGLSLCLKLVSKERVMPHIKVSFLNKLFILE